MHRRILYDKWFSIEVENQTLQMHIITRENRQKPLKKVFHWLKGNLPILNLVKDMNIVKTNYLLINKIMDNVLGNTNFQYIQEEILLPLKLNNTYDSLKEVNLERIMSSYHLGYPNNLKTDDYGMLATAKDVAFL